jgi:hypothetical protein
MPKNHTASKVFELLFLKTQIGAFGFPSKKFASQSLLGKILLLSIAPTHAHLASYPVGTRADFCEGKAVEL